MHSMLVIGVSLVALMGCTTSRPPDQASPSSPATTSQAPSTPAHKTVVLRVGQNRLNLKRGVNPGDMVVCDGMTLRVPEHGHRGKSGKVWVVTSTTGSVSMGCRTQVYFGTTTNLY